MNLKVWFVSILASSLLACTPIKNDLAPAEDSRPYAVVMDAATARKVAHIIENSVLPNQSKSPGEVIEIVSHNFLDTPYKANTLIGSASEPEALVANFNGVDCFTLIDYVEALRRSHDRDSFLKNLVDVRYTDGKVEYLKRKHFFTDWATNPHLNAIDVTQSLSLSARSSNKQLNRKENCDCKEYIPGLGFIKRTVFYIPSADINAEVLSKIKNGDYIGVYSTLIGLDVSHVGIAVRHDGQVWFRNASSLSSTMKVVDIPLQTYMLKKPGMVVLRSLTQ